MVAMQSRGVTGNLQKGWGTWGRLGCSSHYSTICQCKEEKSFNLFGLQFSHLKKIFSYSLYIFLCYFKNLFIYLFIYLAALGLCCCAWAFSSCSEQGLLFVEVHGLVIVVASLVEEHGLQARGLQQLWLTGSVVVAHELQSTGSVVVAHRLSCSAACGIFPGQGSNPCPLHWQAEILNHCTTREVPPILSF